MGLKKVLSEVKEALLACGDYSLTVNTVDPNHSLCQSKGAVYHVVMNVCDSMRGETMGSTSPESACTWSWCEMISFNRM